MCLGGRPASLWLVVVLQGYSVLVHCMTHKLASVTRRDDFLPVRMVATLNMIDNRGMNDPVIAHLQTPAFFRKHPGL